jgi:tol-pal system protein YbgF
MAIAFFLFMVTGCQTAHPDRQAITQLSKELEATNQKIDELYHRVSVVQLMVDNHDKSLADLEKNLKSKRLLEDKGSDEKIATVEKHEITKKPANPKNDDVINTPVPNEKPELLDKKMVPEKHEDVDKSSSSPLVGQSDLIKKETPPINPTIENKTPGIVSTAGVVPDKNESPEYLYNQGFAAMKNKNYARSESLFKTVVSKYPKHRLAVNAVYWTGEIYYTQMNYLEAIKTFNKLIDTYPDGSKIPDALLKIGYSYQALKDKENAVKYLKKVVVDFPFTEPGSKAEAMLNKIE